jgi:hypothetical protein
VSHPDFLAPQRDTHFFIFYFFIQYETLLRYSLFYTLTWQYRHSKFIGESKTAYGFSRLKAKSFLYDSILRRVRIRISTANNDREIRVRRMASSSPTEV